MAGPAAELMGLATGYISTQVVGTIARLGVPDVLSPDTPKAVADVANEVGADPVFLGRLLRAAAAKGLLQSQDGGYILTPMGALLQTDRPGSMKPGVLMHAMPSHYIGMGQMYNAVKTGRSCFAEGLGSKDVWEHCKANPEESKVFNDAMTMWSSMGAGPCAQAYDYGQHSSVVDIGGGHGKLLSTVLDKYPCVQQGIVVDLAQVVDTAPPVPEALQGRMSFMAGDMFEGELPQAEVYVMRHILHDWDDASCVRILKNIKAHMKPDNKIVNYDMVVPDSGDEPHSAKDLDMVMMNVANSGKERTSSEWHELFQQAGFKVDSITQLPGSPLCAIVASAT